MPVLIRAHIDRSQGKALLRFPYHEETKNRVKALPGARWNPENKAWLVPLNMLEVMRDYGLVVDPIIQSERRAAVPPVIADRLRPYQLEACDHLIRNRGFLLTMEQRTGKTPVLIGAATALLNQNYADTVLVFYPAGVRWSWRDQLKAWANVDMIALEGKAGLSDEQIWYLRQRPYLFLGCHYDILGDHGADLHRIVAGRRYIVVADEVQHIQNRKIDRTKVAFSLSHGLEAHAQWYSKSQEPVERGPFDIVNPATGEVIAVPEGIPVASWGSTGTPQRNYPKNVWALMHFAQQGCVSAYHKYTERYCDGHYDDMGHWNDDGESNPEELAARLRSMSYRKTRAEVAAWLPMSDRKVILCEMPEKMMSRYRKLERHYAPQVKAAMHSGNDFQGGEAALRQLVQATSGAKLKTAMERAYEHVERGVKVVVFAHFHETLGNLFDRFADEESPPCPVVCAGGWMTPAKRHEAIEKWKACPGPAVLLANSLSSGTGIDLADAEVAIFLELEWVPADFRQAEDRIQDVHLGKRRTPPIYEYLLVKDTVDEEMAAALLEKIKSIEKVVGKDVETGGVASTLRGAGVVGSARLGLPNDSKETVEAALAGINARWADISTDTETNAAGIAQDFEDHWEDEEENPSDQGGDHTDDEDVPF